MEKEKCENCKHSYLGYEFTGSVLVDGTLLECRRFPKSENVPHDYKCGEYKPNARQFHGP